LAALFQERKKFNPFAGTTRIPLTYQKYYELSSNLIDQFRMFVQQTKQIEHGCDRSGFAVFVSGKSIHFHLAERLTASALKMRFQSKFFQFVGPARAFFASKLCFAAFGTMPTVHCADRYDMTSIFELAVLFAANHVGFFAIQTQVFHLNFRLLRHKISYSRMFVLLIAPARFKPCEALWIAAKASLFGFAIIILVVMGNLYFLFAKLDVDRRHFEAARGFGLAFRDGFGFFQALQ
jgi:hypothetical protein